MYASIEDFRRLLPSPITLGSANIGTPSPGTSTATKDQITPAEAKSERTIF